MEAFILLNIKTFLIMIFHTWQMESLYHMDFMT